MDKPLPPPPLSPETKKEPIPALQRKFDGHDHDPKSHSMESRAKMMSSKSDEVIEFSVKNLVPIPSEYEVTFDDESECDVPIKDESSLVFTTFSNPLFDCIDDFTSSDDESISIDEDVPMEDFKVYSNPHFDDEEISSDETDPHYFNAESDLIKSFSKRDKFDYLEEFPGELMPTAINSCPRPLEKFQVNTIIETLLTSTIPVEDSDSCTITCHFPPFYPLDKPFPPPPLTPKPKKEPIPAVLRRMDGYDHDPKSHSMESKAKILSSSFYTQKKHN
nr:hypothetical protein [Tanacetum cinerariifolium]